MENNEYLGVVEDPRSEERKDQDYKHEDLAQGEVVLNWREYEGNAFKNFPIQNQDGSLSCVGQATSKILAMHEVLEGREYKQLCPKFIYDLRGNYPSGGMWMQDALSIACKSGSCLETSLPCDMQGETFMNDKSLITSKMKEEATHYKAQYYFEIKSKNIDEIAKVMEQGYGILLWFRFDYDEWTDVPTLHVDSKFECSHGVAGVDYCLYNGEKALIIEDSWGPGYGRGGRRIITETFLNARCLFAGYITSLSNYIFTKTLRVGSRGIDVKKLQEKLNTQGYILKVDGSFGKMTRQAVVAFQLKHQLVPDGIVGKLTNKTLNEL